MNELMANHVIGIAERPAERQDNPAPEGLSHTAGSFAELTLDDVGLFEIRMRGVEHERLPSAQLMPENCLQTNQPPFRHPARNLGSFAFFRIEIDVEVIRFQDLIIELR